MGLLALSAVLLSAGAAAQDLGGGAAGHGALALEPAPGALAARHDPGSAGLGDDTFAVEGAGRVEAAWHGAPVATSLAAGSGGLRAEHGALAAAAGAAMGAWRAAPAPLGGVGFYMGPAGLDVYVPGYEHWLLGYDAPLGLWPDQGVTPGWGVGYDEVTVPGALAGSSDELLDRAARDAAVNCRGLARATGVAVPGCRELGRDLRAALPAVTLRAALPGVALVLLRDGAGPEGAGALAPGDAARAATGHLAAASGVSPATADHGQALDLASAAPPAAPATEAVAPPPARAAGALAAAAAPPGLAWALAASLALLAPVWVLYRRVLAHRALDHPLRRAIVELARARPGLREADVARALGLRHNHVQYHVQVLTQARLVEVRPFGGTRCLFETGRLSPAQKALAMAARGRTGEVLAVVQDAPGVSQRALAQRLGMSESSVKWHLDRLEDSGVVRTERARGHKRAWPGEGALPPAAPPPPAAAASAAPLGPALPAAPL